tara:strand:- start:888 stop:1721 length:834 start_codon:yes stop_codon:yes gene_type:complete
LFNDFGVPHPFIINKGIIEIIKFVIIFFNIFLIISKITHFMFSKNLQKKISKLYFKKYRLEMGLFVAEGEKVVNDLLHSDFEIESIYSTKRIDQSHFFLSSNEMNKISFLKTPSSILGIFKIPKKTRYIESNDTIIALDSIKDPGNLGAIIRLCDWFGINNIICSRDSVECYNPKVVQSSMGSLARVNCLYLDLNSFFIKTQKKVYGTFLKGKSIYKNSLEKNAIYLFGNESKGISKIIDKQINERITIPRFNHNNYPDSINVSNSTAIVLSEIFRD